MPKADLFTYEGSPVIKVETTYQDRHLMTELPGGRFNRRLGVWLAPLSWPTCVTLRGLFGDDLEIEQGLMEWAWRTRETRIEPAHYLRSLLELPTDVSFPELDEVEKNHHFKLFSYQRVDVKFLLLSERCILANEPGLGKTAVAIRFMQVLQHLGKNPFPAIIICPNSLKFATWQKELAMWAPELTVQVIDGPAGKRRKQLAVPADCYVINWDSVRLHSKLAPYGSIELSDTEREDKELNDLRPRTVLMDEAHRLKDPRSKQTRAAWAVAHLARYRVAITGTPVADHIGDIWSLGHAAEKTWFPAKTKFMDRYAMVSLNFFGGAEVLGINPATKDEFYQIIDPLMRRVPKTLALPQLPPLLPIQFRHTPMTTKQQALYSQMRDEMAVNLNELLVAPNPLVQLTRLMQFAASAAEIDEDGNVKLTNPSAKIDDLLDLLDEMGEAPLVVAAVSRQLIELASKKMTDKGITHGLVTGAQSPEQRRMAIDAFQAGRTRAILLTLGAGAEGITLTAADTMLFMQESFSEIQNKQARDRVYRIGSEIHSSVRIIKQITPGTVEENKLLLLEGKRERMEEVVRDEATLKMLLGVK
jgi:SNF2 family DNA or RNA helicase